MSTEEMIIAIIAVAAGSVLKSISGVGLPLVAVPAIAYVADIETAVAVIALPNLALNFALAVKERRQYPLTRDLPVLAVAGFAGGALGTLLLTWLAEEVLILMLIAVVIAYAVTFFTAPDLRIDPAAARRASPVVGLIAGSFQGAVGISGPVVASWIHSYRLPRAAFVFSVTTLFAAAGFAQIPTLVLSDQMDGRWTTALIACLPALATIPVGTRLRDAFTVEGFDRFVVLLLLGSVAGLAIRTFS